jgi:hypothetical protein
VLLMGMLGDWEAAVAEGEGDLLDVEICFCSRQSAAFRSLLLLSGCTY